MAALHAAYLVAEDMPAEADVAQAIERHAGRHETTLNGRLVAGFDSARDAAACAVEAIRALVQKDQQSGPRMRIGVSDTDADAAAALAEIAEPGGLCLSRTAYYEVRYQLDLPYGVEIGVDSTAYTCGEIRGKRKTMNLVDLSAVRVSPSALRGRGKSGGLLAKVKALIRRRARLAGVASTGPGDAALRDEKK